MKMERAREHLKQLNAEEVEWFKDRKHYSVRKERDPDNPVYLIGKVTADPIPVDPLGLLIGDCVQNLRGTLDHLAFTLARAHTGDPLPPEIEKYSQFPIIGNEGSRGQIGVGAESFESSRFRIKGIHPDAQAIIQELQPYHRRDLFREHPLWILSVLSNIDKHRLIHPVAGYAAGLTFSKRQERFIPGPGFIQSFGGIVKGETTFCRFPFTPLDDEMDLDLHPPMKIAFDEVSPVAAERKVIETLAEIFDFIGQPVIERLVPFVRAGGTRVLSLYRP